MSVVYFIQSGACGPVKIGYASNLAKRVEALQCGSPEPLVVLATFEGDATHERAVHDILKAHRLRGEWFHPHADVIECAARAKAGLPLGVEHLGEVTDHSSLLETLGVMRVSSALAQLPVTVRAWRARNRIPVEHWPAVIALAASDELPVTAEWLMLRQPPRSKPDASQAAA